MNLSESGMLLQPAIDAQIGQEVGVQFKIAEIRASLEAKGLVIRKEGTERIGVEFVGLELQDRNAIQVYVTGHLERLTRGESPKFGPRRMFQS